MTVVSKHLDEVILLIKEINKENFNGSICDLKNKFPNISEHTFKIVENDIEGFKTPHYNIIIEEMIALFKKD